MRLKQPPGEPADDAADRHRHPAAPMRQRRPRCGRNRCSCRAAPSEVRPGEDDGGDDQAAGAHFEGAAHLLDGEDDAGQRRVEGGGDAGGRAGQDQARLPARRQPADRNITRRRPAPSAPRGRSRRRRAGPSSVSTILPTAMRSDTSRARAASSSMWRAAIACGNAAALRARKEAQGEIDGDRKAQRRQQHRRIGPAALDAEETQARQIGKLGEARRDQARVRARRSGR